MIDQQTIDRIMEAANIVDVVSEFVSLRRRGVNFVGLCPFHTDKTPSFYVSPSKNICKCFSCGEGGTVVHFIMKHEQFSYPQALRYLAKKYHIDIPERELTDQEKQQQDVRESMQVINSWAEGYFVSNLLEHAEGRSIGLSYFRERGFGEEIIRKFRLGYCLGQYDALYREATDKGFQQSFLEKTGLISVYEDGSVRDRFRERVIFPIHSLSGKVVGFGGRTLQKEGKIAKYVNSPESELYHKSRELYGIFFARQAITRADRCYLVEGYTDVISMHQAGIENVVSSSGTSLTQGQIRLLRRFTQQITVLYDGDAAGIKAAIRGIDMLLEEGMNVKVLLLPEGEDPDSFARKHRGAAFTDFIRQNETDFIRFKTRLLLDQAGNDPLQRTSLISDILHSIALIPDEIARSVYLRECSASLEVDERILLSQVRKIRLTAKPGQPAATPAPSPTLPPAPETTAPPPEEVSAFEPYEKALIRYIIRYGNLPLYDYPAEDGAEARTLSVTGYIHQELQADDLAFRTPLYQKVFEEAIARQGEAEPDPSRYFLSHPDPAVSRLAAELVSDKYPLSKVHFRFREEETEIDKLPLLVPKDIFALKDAHLEVQRKNVLKLLKEAQKNDDAQRITELFGELSRLDKFKGYVNKGLGERIILKM
ncbi:MAG: DNA primase [Tannerellaceae bacterium]|jgi:DNA primase|nr:DNA primase [Tannerellaceae bacterium]